MASIPVLLDRATLSNSPSRHRGLPALMTGHRRAQLCHQVVCQWLQRQQGQQQHLSAAEQLLARASVPLQLHSLCHGVHGGPTVHTCTLHAALLSSTHQPGHWTRALQGHCAHRSEHRALPTHLQLFRHRHSLAPAVAEDTPVQPTETESAPAPAAAAQAPPTAAELSGLIAALQSLTEAEVLLYVHGQHMRSRHVAQLMVKLATLDLGVDNAKRRIVIILRILCSALESSVHELKPKELVGCVWACAKLGASPQGAVPLLMHTLIHPAAPGQPTPLSALSGTDTSNLAWALSALQLQYGNSLEDPTAIPQNTSASSALAAAVPQQATASPELPPGSSHREAAHSLEQQVQQRQQQEDAQTQHRARHRRRRASAQEAWPYVVGQALRVANQMQGDDVARTASALSNAVVYHKGLFNSLAERAIALCPATRPATDPVSDSQLATMSFRERRMVFKQRRVAAQAAAAGTALVVTKPGGAEERALAVADTLPAATAVGGQMLSSESVCELVVSFTTAQHRHPRLFAALARCLLHRQAVLSPEDVSQLLWGYASWQFYDRPLVQQLAGQSAKRIRFFTATQLSRVLWSLATLQHHDPEVWKRLPRALAQLQQAGEALTPSQAVNVLWALAVLPPSLTGKPQRDMHTVACVERLASQLEGAVTSDGHTTALSGSQLRRVFWAAGALTIAVPAATTHLHRLALAILHRLPVEGTAAQLAPIHHAALMLGLQQQQECAHRATRLASGPGTGNSPEASGGALHSTEDTISRPSPGTDAITSAASAPTHTTPPATVRTGQQMPVMDLSYVKPLPMFIATQPRTVLPEHSLLAKEHAATKDSPGSPHTIIHALAHAAHHAARELTVQQAAAVPNPDHDSTASSNTVTGSAIAWNSKAHTLWRLEVAQVLELLGIHAQEQVPAVHKTLLVDLALDTRHGKVAVVLGAPWLYSRSMPHLPLGHGLLTRKLLAEDGWVVAVVPWYEWRLMATEEEQLMHLCGVLEQAGVPI